MRSPQADPKHILFIPSWYFDKEAEGMFIHEHARMTVQRGHRVGLIYARQGSLFDKAEVISNVKDGINMIVRKAFSLPKATATMWQWKGQYRMLYKLYCAQFGQPHIIHAHGYLAGIAAQHLADREGLPFVITEHSTAIPQGNVPPYHAEALRRTYENAKALIAVSAFLKTAMEKWCSTHKEIEVIGNPVDVKKYPLSHRLRGEHEIRLISVGSLEKRKNYPLLLQALHILLKQSHVKLILIGTGPERERLESLAKQLDIQDNVIFAGYVQEAEYARLLSEADFFVSSSTMENFGVAIVEALTCGVPVISTPSGGPEEYLHTDIGRIAKAHTAEALCDAILDAVSNNSNFNSIEIRDNVKSKFDFPVIGRQIEKVYQSILPTAQ